MYFYNMFLIMKIVYICAYVCDRERETACVCNRVCFCVKQSNFTLYYFYEKPTLTFLYLKQRNLYFIEGKIYGFIRQ